MRKRINTFKICDIAPPVMIKVPEKHAVKLGLHNRKFAHVVLGCSICAEERSDF